MAARAFAPKPDELYRGQRLGGLRSFLRAAADSGALAGLPLAGTPSPKHERTRRRRHCTNAAGVDHDTHRPVISTAFCGAFWSTSHPPGSTTTSTCSTFDLRIFF